MYMRAFLNSTSRFIALTRIAACLRPASYHPADRVHRTGRTHQVLSGLTRAGGRIQTRNAEKTIRADASFRLSSAFLNRIDRTSGPVTEMALDVAHGERWSCATFLALKR